MDMSGLTPAMGSARAAMTADAFQTAAHAMGRRRTAIRERLQDITSEQILEVLQRLAAGDHPSEEDLDVVRLWIVGDADSYLRQENNFDDWLDEFDRLREVVARYEGVDCGESELLELKGILEDAVRVAHDIANYLEKRERVEQFEAAVAERHSWDSAARETLLRILRGKVERPEV